MIKGNPISVVLVDDHNMVREALARILEDSSNIRVLSQLSHPTRVVEEVLAVAPDVVVLDYSMPDLDAPGVIKQLLDVRPTTKVLVLTVHQNIHYAVRALESGACGYLVKSAAVEELIEAIKTVHSGSIYLSSTISQEVTLHMRKPARARVGVESLSPREFGFLRMLGSGKTLKQCAREMKISNSTASTYRTRIMEKLSLSSTPELIRFALEHGIDA